MTGNYSAQTRAEMLDALNGFLADTVVVYFKTHSFHWNIEGVSFYGVHLMFETFYKNLWESMDEIAERIRTFNEKIPPSIEILLKYASMAETEVSPSQDIMLQNLRDDYIALSKRAHEVGTTAEKHGDWVTVDMMSQRSAFLDKAAWMCQSSLRSLS